MHQTHIFCHLWRSNLCTRKAWYQLGWDEDDETYFTNVLQEVIASNPIHPKASNNSTPTTMNISQDMTTSLEPLYNQPSTSNGKEPAHQGSSHVHPSLFRQFASIGPEPTVQMAINTEDFEWQKRTWFHEWSTTQQGINPKFDDQVTQLLTQYRLAAPEQTHIQALQPHLDAPQMDCDVTHRSL